MKLQQICMMLHSSQESQNQLKMVYNICSVLSISNFSDLSKYDTLFPLSLGIVGLKGTYLHSNLICCLQFTNIPLGIIFILN